MLSSRMPKNKQKKIPAPNIPEISSFVPNQPVKTLRDDVNHNKLMPHLSFYHLDEAAESISDWTSSETKQLFTKLKQLSKTTWQEILSSKGMGYKEIQNSGSFARQWPVRLSRDCTMSEIRISQKSRIFGVRRERAFYLVWLDRNHQVLPENKQHR